VSDTATTLSTPTPADLDKALKAVRSSKKPESYVRIQMDYGNYLVLPYKQGIAFLQAVEGAVVVKNRYGEAPSCRALDADTFQMAHLSQEDYETIRMAELLNVSLNDMKDLRQRKTWGIL